MIIDKVVDAFRYIKYFIKIQIIFFNNNTAGNLAKINRNLGSRILI